VETVQATLENGRQSIKEKLWGAQDLGNSLAMVWYIFIAPLRVFTFHAGEEPPIVDDHVKPPTPLEEVCKEALPLPKDFEWTTLNITSSGPKEIKEFHDLLSPNYIIEDDAASYSVSNIAPSSYSGLWKLRTISRNGIRVRESVFRATRNLLLSSQAHW